MVEEEEQEHDDTIPIPVVEYLKRRRTESDESALGFVNTLIHRMFLTYRVSQSFKRLWGAKMSVKFNRKLQDNAYISNIQIVDVKLGERPPSFNTMNTKILDDLAIVNSFYCSYWNSKWCIWAVLPWNYK
jgi:hypothetical protein